MNISSLFKVKASSMTKASIGVIASILMNIIAEISVLLGLPALVGEIFIALSILFAVLAIYMIRKIGKELSRSADVCSKVDRGDLEARLLNINEFGSLGRLQHKINDLVDRSDAYVRESVACLEYVEQNKYFRKILETGMTGAFVNAARTVNKATDTMFKKTVDFTDVADNFEKTMKGVVETVASAATELQASAKTMEGTAQSTSEKSTVVAAAAEEASTNVQTVASASEELSSSISEISRQVTQSTQIASSAVAEVDGANEKVKGLADSADKIGEVVAMITDIADQTNLLALNATIEAARAGEAGKGFAVVASEVKNLATQTAKATEEISMQIGDIQGATQEAVSVIGSIGGTISEMSEITSAIAAAVEEQGSATQEIARNVEQAASGTTEVTSNIVQVTEAAKETGESANQVLGAAGELSKQAEVMSGEMDKFVIEMRKII